MSKINNIHDKYFRKTLSNPQVAEEFCQLYLPTGILKELMIESLELQNTSFITTHLKQFWSDILFKVNFKQGEGYLYVLIEHQSTPDPLMPFRIYQYKGAIMAHHIEKINAESLPIVVPIVFYQGLSPYCFSTDIYDLFGNNKILAKATLLQPFTLVNLSKIPDEEIKKHQWLGVLEFVQKYIRHKHFLQHFKEIMPLLKRLEEKGADWYIISTLVYAASAVTEEDDFYQIIEPLASELGGKVMSLKQFLLRKGEAQGFEKGIEKGVEEGCAKSSREIAEKLLQEKVDLALIARVTGLKYEEIEKLALT